MERYAVSVTWHEGADDATVSALVWDGSGEQAGIFVFHPSEHVSFQKLAQELHLLAFPRLFP
jgi:hypothetical protein